MSVPTWVMTWSERLLLPLAPQLILASQVPVAFVGTIFGPSRRTGHGGALGCGPSVASESSPVNPLVFSPPLLPLPLPWWVGTTMYWNQPPLPAIAASSAALSVMYSRRSRTLGASGAGDVPGSPPAAAAFFGAGVPAPPALGFLTSDDQPPASPMLQSRVLGSTMTLREMSPGAMT